MTDTIPAIAFRSLLRSGELVVAPGAFDPYSARVVESLGFPAVYLGGNALGLQLGIPQPFVTLTETADAVHRVRRLVRIPLIVDAGAGFGAPANAALSVRTLVHAGATAIHMDDQTYPKRAHYHRGQGKLDDVTSVCEKLSAMASARNNSDVVLIARTDAFRVTKSVEQTIERCKHYAATGIDALMVLDLTVEHAPQFQKAFPHLPLVWIGGIAEPVPTVAELQAAGVALAVYPFNATAAVTEALFATWRGLQENGRPLLPARPTAQTLATALDLIGIENYLSLERTQGTGSGREP